MREITLDASTWQMPADFARALKDALGAPEPDVRDPDALVDSIVWNTANRVQPPYRIRIVNATGVPAAVADDIALLSRMVADARVLRRDLDGTDIGVRILVDGQESH